VTALENSMEKDEESVGAGFRLGASQILWLFFIMQREFFQEKRRGGTARDHPLDPRFQY
jgi:hypothetical protein